MFDDDRQYENCPEEFRENCTFKSVKCSSCRACDGNNATLHYAPITNSADLAYKEHPSFKQAKQAKKDAAVTAKREQRSKQSFKDAQRNSRQGRKVEKKVLKQLDARSTVGSGAVFGDGDGYLGLPGGHRLYIEHKARLANRNTLGPTSDEWEKGRQQGCEVFLTTSDTHGTVVTMSQKTFNELMELVRQQNNN